jgi:hypothetical protein
MGMPGARVGNGLTVQSGGTETNIYNNTIVGNYVNGIHSDGSAAPYVRNNIIWGNGTAASDGIYGLTGTVIYNCVQGGYTGAGNFGDQAPQFVSQDTNDFHITYGIKCVDTNSTYTPPSSEKDIDGNPRVLDGDRDGVAKIDAGADELVIEDFNYDGIVNLKDYAMFARNWQATWSGSNSKDVYDLKDDNVINFKDLSIFDTCWLMNRTGPTTVVLVDRPAGGMGMSLMQQNESESDSNSTPPPGVAGDGQTAHMWFVCDNNMPNIGDEVTVTVYSDMSLFCLGVYGQITGDAILTTAMDSNDCTSYGWDPGWNSDPYLDDDGYFYIDGVSWNATATGVVGYFKFHYNCGQIAVNILENDSYPTDALFSPRTYYIGDPNQY